MIFPRVKNITEAACTTCLPSKISVCVTREYSKKSCELLKLFLPQFNFYSQEENAIITANKHPYVKKNSEEYSLSVKNGKIHIEYYNYIGLRNAFSTLSLLIYFKDNLFFINDTEIEDYPSLEHRGVMLDLARGVKDFDQLIDDIILIAKSRMNYLHLHLADGGGVCFELDSLPKECRITNAYTKKQIKTLISLSETLGLEIIPEYDLPAHSNRLLEVFEELKCDTNIPGPHSTHAACSGTPKLYEIYEAIIKEIASLFPGKYLHIGGDELDFADVPHLMALCYWDSCSKCKALREKHNLFDRQEQYYYVINRVHKMVKSTGKTMIMWSDQIDCTRPRNLPIDIIMQFWRVAGEGRGPHEGCSMNGQLKMGYTIINSYYPQAYGDEEEYMSSQKLQNWQCFTDPECDKEYINQIIGSEVCLWNYGDRSEKFSHYAYSLPSAILLMADKLWNNDIVTYDRDFSTALTRTLLGACTPIGLDVFGAIGDILPPRTTSKIYLDKVTLTKDEIRNIVDLSSQSNLYSAGDSVRAKIYKDCAEYALEQL